jgi:hypothetical protein
MTRALDAVTIDMPAYGRPAAHGPLDTASTITVTFPDDRTYTGTLQALNTIRWSNGWACIRIWMVTDSSH